jgi:uncharacterized protein YwgA
MQSAYDHQGEEEAMRISTEGLWRKLGTIIRLVEQSPQGTLGRTAIVKLLYFLQEVRGMGLGYDFRLYTYGPFASEVLNDLETAQSFQALHIRTVLYPSGYGYDVKAGSKAADVKECVADWLASHESDLAWAVENFAARSASELEIMATIVYVAREFAKRAKPYGPVDLAQRVREVKPRFAEQYVLEKCAEARDLGLLPSGA